MKRSTVSAQSWRWLRGYMTRRWRAVSDIKNVKRDAFNKFHMVLAWQAGRRAGWKAAKAELADRDAAMSEAISTVYAMDAHIKHLEALLTELCKRYPEAAVELSIP